MANALEVSASVLEPHFDAARDAFVDFSPEEGVRLSRARQTKLLVVPPARLAELLQSRSKRHYAGASTDGLRVIATSELAHQSTDVVVAVFAHELGHAVDYLYPGCWSWPVQQAGRAVWVGTGARARAAAWRALFGKASHRSRSGKDDAAPSDNWLMAWQLRSTDSVEWAADGIAEAVLGQRPHYCGPCLVQCFSRAGVERPAGLR